MYNLDDPVFSRSDHKFIDTVLQDLGVAPPPDFVEFYRRYKGPFRSSRTSYKLADLCEGLTHEDSIPIATKTVRKSFNLPAKFLVISNMVEHGVMVYDTETGTVFSAASEGGLNEVVAALAQPDFQTFSEFLEWYFELEG